MNTMGQLMGLLLPLLLIGVIVDGFTEAFKRDPNYKVTDIRQEIVDVYRIFFDDTYGSDIGKKNKTQKIGNE